MQEAAEVGKRDGGDSGVRGRGHLEAVAVRFRVADAAGLRRLFAGDPRAPRRRPARAVRRRAAETDELPQRQARHRIDDERRRAAAGEGIVRPRPGRDRKRHAVFHFVIAHEPQLAADLERGHAVRAVGGGIAVVEQAARASDDGVAEVGREEEQHLVRVVGRLGPKRSVRRRDRRSAGPPRRQPRERRGRGPDHRTPGEHAPSLPLRGPTRGLGSSLFVGAIHCRPCVRRSFVPR